MKLIDMHVHSTCSDGLLTVEQLIDTFYLKGLPGFALTDHDTFLGLIQALEILQKKKYNLFFIPGCEFSTYHEKYGELHVLAYFKTREFSNLDNRITAFQNGRHDRFIRMVECLARENIHVKVDHLLSSAIPIGRMHLARELVRQGFCRNSDEAFEKYLRAGCSCYVPRKEVGTAEMIKVIKDAGGVAVLAHPTILYKSSGWDVLPEFFKAGLDGLEYRHPKIQIDLAQKIYERFKDKCLLTGGSDFHGENSTDDLGRFGITLETAQNTFVNFTDFQ